jgi:hypothetical protein
MVTVEMWMAQTRGKDPGLGSTVPVQVSTPLLFSQVASPSLVLTLCDTPPGARLVTNGALVSLA